MNAPSGICTPNVSARNISTAPTTAAFSSAGAAAARPPMYPRSITPTPPGVIGTAERSRLNENTAKTWAVLMSCSETPMLRSDSRSTTASVTWLRIVVQRAA